MRTFSAVLCAALALYGTGPVNAQTYPTKSVRLIVPFAVGGASDVVFRIVSPRLSEFLGQQVVVDNKGGANGILGTELTAKSLPDGHTIQMASNGTHAVNSALYPKLPYDPVKDFAPITVVVFLTNMLVVHPSLPAKTIAELVALARAKPGTLTFGSGGAGGTPHLSAELFKSMARIDMIHVPYKSGGLSTTALLSGEVVMTFNTVLTSLNFVKEGRLRALGITGSKRSPLLPDVPTISEAGFPGYEASTWYGMVAPAGTSPAIVTRLYEDTVKVLTMPKIRNQLINMGADPVGNTPDEFAAIIKSDLVKWAKVVKASGARPD